MFLRVYTYVADSLSCRVPPCPRHSLPTALSLYICFCVYLYLNWVKCYSTGNVGQDDVGKKAILVSFPVKQ